MWAKLLRIPRPQLYAGILFFACLGAYSVDRTPSTSPCCWRSAGVGFAIRRFGIPVLPLILGVILGPLMEVKMREALDLSDGDVSGLFNEPLAIFVYVLVVLVVVAPRADRAVPSTRARSSTTTRRSPMAVVIGFIPDKYGEAALAAGLEEANRRRRPGWWSSTRTRGDALVDKRYLGAEGMVTLEQRLADSGVEHEVRQTMGRDIADEILAVAADVDAEAIVIGIRHRRPVGKLIMGSVAQRVISTPPAP